MISIKNTNLKNKLENLINAFISAEDKKFYSHFGIDYIAIIRASISNLISIFNNQRLIGASTITQQVVKNLLLTNEVSFDRKIISFFLLTLSARVPP